MRGVFVSVNRVSFHYQLVDLERERQREPDLQHFFLRFQQATGQTPFTETSPEAIRAYLKQSSPLLTTEHLCQMFGLGDDWVDLIPAEINLFTLDARSATHILTKIAFHTHWLTARVPGICEYYDHLFLTFLQDPSFLPAIQNNYATHPDEVATILYIAAEEGLEPVVQTILQSSHVPSGSYLARAWRHAIYNHRTSIAQMIENLPKSSWNRLLFNCGTSPRLGRCASSCTKCVKYSLLATLALGFVTFGFSSTKK